MATEMQSQATLSKEKAPVFFAAEIYRCKNGQEIENVLSKYSNYKFSTDFVLSVLQDAGTANLTPLEKVHFDNKIKSIRDAKNKIETQKITHVPRPALKQ